MEKLCLECLFEWLGPHQMVRPQLSALASFES